MKYTWTESDIIPGRVVCKPAAYHGETSWKATGSSAKWTFKIGYLPSLPSDRHYCLISMTDGMVSSEGKTKAEMAEHLNQSELMPMPHKWLLETMEFLRDCYDHQR